MKLMIYKILFNIIINNNNYFLKFINKILIF